MSPLESAISICGSQAALASALQIKQQHVWNWLNRPGAKVPAEYCPAIERATAGKVRCEELRPDVAWDVLRMQALPSPDAPPAQPEPSHVAG
jgi:DNA-binding transcriptional regulator YdaS (Cro superfamily)